jgi:hypothetical protein
MVIQKSLRENVELLSRVSMNVLVNNSAKVYYYYPAESFDFLNFKGTTVNCGARNGN